MSQTPEADAANPEQPPCSAMHAPDPRTRWQKIIGRMFPGKHCFVPEDILHEEYHDCLHLTTVSDFSFWDRIRILITGRVTVRSKVITEGMIGKHVANSVAFPSTRNQHS